MKKNSPSKRYFTPLSVLGLYNPQIAQMTSPGCLFSPLESENAVFTESVIIAVMTKRNFVCKIRGIPL